MRFRDERTGYFATISSACFCSIRRRKASELLAPALRASSTHSHESYPIFDRTYDLRKLPAGITADGDMWLVEISYEQIAAYHPAMTFPPQQRIAFAAELFDAGGRAQT
jgi:hypothetical protein